MIWHLVCQVLLLGHIPHPLRHNPVCANTSDESEAACLIHSDPDVRIVIPVVARQVVANDGCMCTTNSYCISNGIEVNPRCGCQDFTGEGSSFCYVQNNCPSAISSATFLGAKYRPCDSPPPPPPAPFACLDPLFSKQWHHLYIRSTDVWLYTKGEGSTIVVIDDGVQYRHPDLRVSSEKSFGWRFSTASRIESANDELSRHGTASAGIAAALRDNGLGGCGIASETTLVAVKLLQNYLENSIDYYFSDDLLVNTFTNFENSERTVLSNSWGPTDDRRVEGPGILQSYSRVDASMITFGKHGRNGKGGVLVFAAGNGGEHDNANDDGFTSHPYTFAVGAIGDDGRRTAYSEPGACIDVVAPSDGGWRSIVTTDITGINGYSMSNSTDSFGGTSAAAPMVSAVIALILSVRSDLSLRDLKRILHTTTIINDPNDQYWVRNAHGRLYSPWYGFGQIDAAAAVAAARTWTRLQPQRELCSQDWFGYLPFTSERVIIPFSTLETDVYGVDEVRVFVDIQHERRGDISLVVISPYATRSLLTFVIPDTLPMQTTSFVAHSYLTHAFSGEYGPRTGWKLEIQDFSRRGRLVRTNICVKGDVFTYLNPPPSSPPLANPQTPPYQPPPAPNSNIIIIRSVMWSIVGLTYGGVVVIYCLLKQPCRSKTNESTR
jgi:subtilisin family serine protease